MRLNTIYNEDCLVTMDNMIANNIKVDMIITSPPYDTARNYKGTLLWNWDIFKEVATRIINIMNEGGTLVWVVNDKVIKGSESGSSFKQALYFMEHGLRLHDTMIYAKNNPVPMNHNRYEQEFEYMFVLTKGRPKVFNPIRVPTKYGGLKRTPSSRKFRKDDSDNISQGTVVDTKYTKIKGNIWYYNVGSGQSSKDRIAFKHPAIFPEQLVLDHIMSWSNEGDLVYDPFMGSGTVAKVALASNRQYIGSEKVKEYCDIAQTRLQDFRTMHNDTK